MAKRVLICGGRDFSDYGELCYQLDCICSKNGITLIIEGGARGADTLARKYAEQMNIPALRFEADWTKHGNAAGPIRNQQMLDEGKPDLVVAFPTKNSVGTYDMIRKAKKAGIDVLEVKEAIKVH